MRPTTTSSSSAAARPASTAPARWPRAACGSPSSSASWSAASARTGPASRRRRCCARARRCTPRATRRRAPQVDVEAALAWRDFMVSRLLRRRPGALARRARASTCCAAAAGSPGPGVVEVDGVRYTAEHVVLANGADPFVPPVPGLRELDGVWTNREATGMKAVPRRLLVLGGGPVGVEMAQAVRRLGGEVGARRGRRARAPARAGAAGRGARRGPARATASSSSSARSATAARRDGDDYVLELDDGRELRGDRLLVATGRRPRVDGIGLETVGIEADAPRDPGRRAPARRRAAVGDRRRHRHLAADARRQVPGRRRRRQHPRRAARGQLRGGARGSSSPTRRRRRSARPRRRFSATAAAVRGGEDRRPTRAPTPSPTAS